MRAANLPTRLTMKVSQLDEGSAAVLADEAVEMARLMAPKMSGNAAAALQPYSVPGEFGIQWTKDVAYVWFQEAGVGPFTMRALAGKTIPMWIDDPTGKERRANPKAETRRTASGKVQVLIFRKASHIGQTRRRSTTGRNGRRTHRVVPASYPGAPGRIAARHASGRIASNPPARSHVGVRWRFPGLHPRQFMHHSLITVAKAHRVSGLIATGYGGG